jgi:predicted  nucleic acid-binding Zn-ribbon protein
MQEIRDLPERVSNLESQILQLRQEMKEEFSATRSELRAEITRVSDEVQAAYDKTDTLMRVLHEDALERIATMGEGRRPRKKRP